MSGPPEFRDSVIAEKLRILVFSAEFTIFRGICKLPQNNHRNCQNFTILAINLRKSIVNQHS